MTQEVAPNRRFEQSAQEHRPWVPVAPRAGACSTEALGVTGVGRSNMGGADALDRCENVVRGRSYLFWWIRVWCGFLYSWGVEAHVICPRRCGDRENESTVGRETHGILDVSTGRAHERNHNV